MSEQEAAPTPPENNGKWSELDELQREVERRIKDNQRFLDGFLDDDYEEDEAEHDDADETFEEL